MLTALRFCSLTLGFMVSLVFASNSPLFTTVNNETQQVVVLQEHASTMHDIVGEKELQPGQVFIAQFESPDEIIPYLIYSLKDVSQEGKCYLKPQRNLKKPHCTGSIQAEVVYLGENSYEFNLYEA